MEKRLYFKNLNALRFFAATAVILHHVEQYKFWAKIPSIWGNTTIDALGQKAVSFFFVLSGFLITYLLMEENRKTSVISIRDFYVRRVLRIWPVYYLVVVICLFVIPHLLDLSFLGIDLYDEKFTWKIILLVAVLPNVLRVYSPNIVGGNQLWSIGVEEQFYLIWPLLIGFFVKRIVPFLFGFILLKLTITVILEFLLNQKGGLFYSALFRFWILLKVEQMAIGALGAWALFSQKENILKLVYSRISFSLSLLLLVLLMLIPVHHWSIAYAEGFIFLSLILNLSTNPSLNISMESPVLARLGNISYGMYMYHTLCITLCIYVLTRFGFHQGDLVLFNILIYSSSIFLTLLVAFVSYEYFEKVFLAMKERFMIVKSGGNADTMRSPSESRS
jgi:peptidoglycan/LPS O-acetylase OafA/YrhL